MEFFLKFSTCKPVFKMLPVMKQRNVRGVWMKRVFWILLLVVSTAGSVFCEEVKERSGCNVCGMYIDIYHHTAAELVSKDGLRQQTCGMACLLRIVQDEGGPEAFASIKVRGWEGKELLNGDGATYVIGSRVIPDMIPNIIAFRSKKEAEDFLDREGGELLDFHQALSAVSPMGMTMPTRVKAAVLPAKGAFGIGVGSMYMIMDEVMIGSTGVDPAVFASGKMTMTPKEMSSRGEMLMMNYGLADDLTLSAAVSYLEKEMQMYTMSGVQTKNNSGISDMNLTLRYNLWRDTYFSKFFTVMAETTLPTGEFTTEWTNMPGLQLGTGDFSFTGGLLYTQRYRNIWLHGLASYTRKLENGDNYKFGDESRAGLALHYTPNYDLMFGLELDGLHQAENENNGVSVVNTGGERSNLSGVVDWRFLTALGGNFSLRMTAGLPVYEDLNYQGNTVALGGGYFVNCSISFKRRFRSS